MTLIFTYYFLFYRRYSMSFSFIFLGINLILIAFDVIRLKGALKKYLIVVALFISLLGYFIGDIYLAYFKVNILEIFALTIFLSLFISKIDIRCMCFVLLLSIISFVVLSLNGELLLMFDRCLYFILLSVILVFTYSDWELSLISSTLFSCIYFACDMYFGIRNVGYAVFDFDLMFSFIIVFYLSALVLQSGIVIKQNVRGGVYV